MTFEHHLISMAEKTIQLEGKAEITARFVNSTNSNIFLTGKAGTGKTTFLRELSGQTHKAHVILAPTGVAALNAQGTTIHSQFLLPPGTYVPERNMPAGFHKSQGTYTQQELAHRHPLNARRREVLLGIDLLIIDEVSMLRADLLDVIDYRMRSVKRVYDKPFGGVQVLMIGDLFQLPPIVNESERGLMNHYYRSPHFFESLALKRSGFVFVELDKIYRQKDDEFIRILNNLRDNQVTQQDVDRLNQAYQENAKADDGVITLTTHNRIADSINRTKLDELPGKSQYFEAEVEDDFPERMFPVHESLELKEGAQIMFMKNDSQDGMYYNGKLAKVVSIKEKDHQDLITVEFLDNGEEFVLRKESWENKRYVVDEKSKEVEEEVAGTFEQYPVKLAWAITIHKSQGLTFNKAVIDVGNAFAPGQVYVALSRLTSLDGLILRTKIQPHVVSSDQEVVRFHETLDVQESLDTLLSARQRVYLQELLRNTFQIRPLIQELENVEKNNNVNQFEEEAIRNALTEIRGSLMQEAKHSRVFVGQLERLLLEDDRPQLLDRAVKGTDYFYKILIESFKKLVFHEAEVSLYSKTKTYRSSLSELNLLFTKKILDLKKSATLIELILEDKPIKLPASIEKAVQNERNQILDAADEWLEHHPKKGKTKSGRTRKKKGKSAPKVKGETYTITYNLIAEGLDIGEIAVKRGLAKSTIEAHFTRGIKEGKIELDSVMSSKDIQAIQKGIESIPEADTKAIYAKFEGTYTFGQIRMVMAELDNHEE